MFMSNSHVLNLRSLDALDRSQAVSQAHGNEHQAAHAQGGSDHRDQRNPCGLRRLSPKVFEKTVASANVPPVAKEQYRQLGAWLHRAQTTRGIKTVVITSARPEEGKTLTGMNLALTLSESYGRRVLIVDIDFRRPALHEAFRAPSSFGLSDLLKSDNPPRLTPVAVTKNLALLVAGSQTDDPMQGLSSGRMSLVLEQAAAQYDWVLLDTPPLGLFPDVRLVAAHADGVILVVSAGRTPHHLVQRAIDALDRDRILGVVLNRAERPVIGMAQASDYYGNYANYR